MATAASKPYPPIPYGMADFRAIRREGFLYVDKTRFVRELENERYTFFLRPRRFGKTCWLSVLEHYYDRTRDREDEALTRSTLEAAKDQLRGYLADERLAMQHPSVRFTGIALVFRGWELVGAEAVAA